MSLSAAIPSIYAIVRSNLALSKPKTIIVVTGFVDVEVPNYSKPPPVRQPKTIEMNKQ